MTGRARLATVAIALISLAWTATATGSAHAAGRGNRLAYLEENNPYAPGLAFPKLITPQWVGEPGVEAVVVLAIDDMRDPAKYETYLRPILNRLKAIDGRAPVSIMTCQVDPKHPQLQAWLREGLNLDVHTTQHPCPLLQKGDFQTARKTVNDCISLLNAIPGNRPVAFRMPCCDSLNSPSPRFFSEIFSDMPAGPKFTTGVFDIEKDRGPFLTIDSSVFNITTPADPALPRSLVEDPDGGERFRKYLPFRSFVNTIENYPYPYVINRLCWEFPCVVPSDWEAQNLQKPNNPRTVADMKAALDAVVLKQGVFNLVFHPHGWIKAEQIVELIDHAVATHGKKVKFLNFREAQERLDKHLLGGEPLRNTRRFDNGVRVLDLDADGFMDVVVGNARTRRTRRWDPKTHAWQLGSFPVELVYPWGQTQKRGIASAGQFGVVRSDGHASLLLNLATAPADGPALSGGWHFDGNGWVEDPNLLSAQIHVARESEDRPVLTGDRATGSQGVRLLDLDGDDVCELIVANARQRGVFGWQAGRWVRKEYALPKPAFLVDERIAIPVEEDRKVILGEGWNQRAGVRFVDLDEDGQLDIVFSDDWAFGVYLFDNPKTGWTRKVAAGKAGDSGAIPKILRTTRNPDRGLEVADNGFWVHSRHLWWQNEDTAKLPDLVDRRSFNDLLKGVEPRGKSAAAALEALQVRPGFRVDLAASEPLVFDPIAFDWSADGRLWVVEMGDYPLGVDGKGKPGGQVRVLTDVDGDGRYDKVDVFLDGLGFPSGIMPWRNGVLVASAPEILYAEDRDGDGKADHFEVLFTGFHPGNQQHRLNGFELGLDGWVYGANGDSGGEVRSLKTGKVVSIRGRDFRFQPDTGAFETESGQTQYGRHRDDWGRWFGNNNPNWGWVFMLAEADLKRNPSLAAPDPRKTLEPDTRLFPVTPIAPRFNDLWAAGRVTSANSPTPYRDELFGPAFANSLFVSEPVHNLVHRMVLDDDGPGLKGRRAVGETEREFLASSDPWFRPTMLKTGPDGALWVADMDRAVIEHPEWIPDDWEKRLDLRAGADRGRIFRVYPVDRALRKIPRLDTLDTAGLVAALESPNGWQRDTAHRLLLHRRDPAAVESLRRLSQQTASSKVMVQALWILENLGALREEDLSRPLDDSSPPVISNAIQLATRAFPKPGALLPRVLRYHVSANPSVRYQLALSLGAWEGPSVGKALAEIARRDGADPWFRAAILTSAPPHVGTLFTELFHTPGFSPPASLVEPLFALAGQPSGRAGLEALSESLSKPAGPNGGFASWQFSAVGGLYDAARRTGTPLAKWFASESTRGRLDRVVKAAHKVAEDARADEETRLAALGLLGRDARFQDREREVVARLLTPQTSDRLQRQVLAAVARGRDPKLPQVLINGWKGYTPAVRGAVLDALMSRAEWAGALLSSLEDTCIPASEIDPSHRAALLGMDRADLRDRARAIFGSVTSARQTVVATYRNAVLAGGDRKAGQAVFKRVCSTCHKLDGIGVEVGPDLAQLTDRSPEALVTAIFDPNRALEARFASFTVQLTDGRALTGLIASESAASITVRRQEGKDDVVPRTEIEAMASSGQSLMPEGLEKDLPPRDAADLVAYLASGGPPPKALRGNTPALVHANEGEPLRLLAATAEIRGESLTFEETYGNLGYWQSSSDRASWSIEGLNSGRYEIWVEWACDPGAAGQTLAMTVAGERVDWKVIPTKSWDEYRKQKVGVIELKTPARRLDAFAVSALHGPLVDLRAIELRPVAGGSCCEPGP